MRTRTTKVIGPLAMKVPVVAVNISSDTRCGIHAKRPDRNRNTDIVFGTSKDIERNISVEVNFDE